MYNPFSLSGKKIIITGASSGIGRQCAIDCSKMGATVILVARNEKRLKETQKEMQQSERHSYYSIDLGQPDRNKRISGNYSYNSW
jgi:short-subunit dehydrogenase